jgi:outer membrane murein-binding lipoprotein Lpp
MENSVLIILFIALVILAGLVFGIGHVLNQRILVLQQQVDELTAQYKTLQSQMEEIQPDGQTAKTAAPAAAVMKNPPVSLGERNLAVMPKREIAVLPKKQTPAPIAADDIDPEVVAVIMAAVAACGYAPTSIRAIHRKKSVKATNWVMAGRLAGMK